MLNLLQEQSRFSPDHKPVPDVDVPWLLCDVDDWCSVELARPGRRHLMVMDGTKEGPVSEETTGSAPLATSGPARPPPIRHTSVMYFVPRPHTLGHRS